MRSQYRDKPPHASDGSSFEMLCLRLHWELLGEHLHLNTDWQSQIEIGDTKEGHEFKELAKSFHTLRIELAERTDLIRSWRDSGILANRKWFVCGSEAVGDIFGFAVRDLRLFRDIHRPREVWAGGRNPGEDHDFLGATIRSYELPKHIAAKFYLYRFCFVDGDWTLWRCGYPDWPPLGFEYQSKRLKND